MTTRRFVTSLALAAVALIALLATVVFLGEPQRAGAAPRRFHSVDLAYLGVPLLLLGAAASAQLRPLARRRRRGR